MNIQIEKFVFDNQLNNYQYIEDHKVQYKVGIDYKIIVLFLQTSLDNKITNFFKYEHGEKIGIPDWMEVDYSLQTINFKANK